MNLEKVPKPEGGDDSQTNSARKPEVYREGGYSSQAAAEQTMRDLNSRAAVPVEVRNSETIGKLDKGRAPLSLLRIANSYMQSVGYPLNVDRKVAQERVIMGLESGLDIQQIFDQDPYVAPAMRNAINLNAAKRVFGDNRSQMLNDLEQRAN